MKLRGVVKGKTIELDEAVGLPEGQRVEVEVQDLGKTVSVGKGLAADVENSTFDTNELVNELREELGI